MLLPRQEVIKRLQEHGEIATARQAEANLPVHVDTTRDATILAKLVARRS